MSPACRGQGGLLIVCGAMRLVQGVEVGERPNILFFHVDNLGFGELSCYSGGPFRGTWTRRIDAFAGQGFRLTNYAPEAQCTPTRSALLTGRPSK